MASTQWWEGVKIRTFKEIASPFSIILSPYINELNSYFQILSTSFLQPVTNVCNTSLFFSEFQNDLLR